MGPIVLFDKSFLQSLSIDEAVWFDHFFTSNIPPIFFTEPLADLKKGTLKGRTPEKEVSVIAAKTPELHSYPNVFHLELCIHNLHGRTVEMRGRPQIMGGKPVRRDVDEVVGPDRLTSRHVSEPCSQDPDEAQPTGCLGSGR